MKEMMVKEIWKDIKNYEEKYQISNLGNIKSMNYDKTKREKLLKPNISNRGYKYINLCKNGKATKKYIHRLVAETFIPNFNNYPVVNHKDNNTLNNNANNLEWCTQSYNVKYAYKCGRKGFWSGKFGGEHCLSRAVIQYDLKENFIKEWDCMGDVERQLGIRVCNISTCCIGKQKTAGGFKWKYKEEKQNEEFFDMG